MRIAVSKVSGRGNTVIPKAIREALRLNSGDRIAYFIDNQHVEIRKDGC